MERALSVSEFLADPVGRYFRGRRAMAFAHSPTLLGMASWGRPDVDDVRELLGLCAIGRRPGMTPYRFLVDLRSLELIEPSTFGQFVEYTRTHGEVLRRNIARQAQIRPGGLVGAIVSGFAALARLPYPDRVFGDVDQALAWIGVAPGEGHALIAELDSIRSSAQDGHEIVARVRRELDGLGAGTASQLARRLGLSTRTLQRALRQAGTTYRIEVTSFRVRRARELLVTSGRPLSWIATELGFSSVQHFVTAFRRAVGETPGAWRARNAGIAEATRAT